MLKNKSLFVVCITALVLIWDIYLHLDPNKTTAANYLYNTGYAMLFFMGTIIGIKAAIKTSFRSSLGKSVLFIGLGETAHGLGLLIWTYYNLVSKIAVPYPSAADIFFITFTLLTAIGCWQFIRMLGTPIKPRQILEGLGFFLLAAVLIVGFVSRPDLSSTLPLATKIINTAYPLGDSMLLTLALLTFRAGGGKLHSSLRLLVTGLFFQVVADILFSYRTANQIYWNGDITDLFYTLSAATLTLALTNIYQNFIKNQAEVVG